MRNLEHAEQQGTSGLIIVSSLRDIHTDLGLPSDSGLSTVTSIANARMDLIARKGCINMRLRNSVKDRAIVDSSDIEIIIKASSQ